MNLEEPNAIVAITDNSAAGKIVVRRAVRLGEILKLPVDIHHILHMPNGNHLTSELINSSLDELKDAEQELRQVLSETDRIESTHAAVEPIVNKAMAESAFITFLTEEMQGKFKTRGVQYLAFSDSQRQLDLDQVALLCGRTSNREHLTHLSELMTSTNSSVKIILEEGGIAYLQDLFGDLGLTDLPVETFRDEASLNKIIKQFKPSLICLPVETFNRDKIEWLRSNHRMDVLLY